ncbi:TA system antitoxin ParD family protein [Vibrio quintilis]|uniref:ParD-like antitoxin of type II bacterial toxin-antitoxin system n=1 Tax=Vibrio quintilis TaxID=1117707 RepID=A0A1M7YWT8_9VIBR|nr:hypothetical protein [Vibrio quintilis]SHO57081.1 hypothetical protein VQ7734_02850 [Vibrio quintilis]
MATSIWLDNNLVENAKAIGQSRSRSAAKQIEYWAQIGRMMEDNPNLLYSLVQHQSPTNNKINPPDKDK